MSNVKCTKCKEHRKDEHFSDLSLKSSAPICNDCSLKSLLTKVEQAKHSVERIVAKQQEAIETTPVVAEETTPTKKRKLSNRDYLKAVLAGKAA